MDLGPIVKAAPELAKGAAAIGAAIPFTAIVKRMLGPAADEVAEMWRDRIRAYRYDRQVKLLEKVEKIAKEHRLKLGPVPPKILFPLLEGASMEDNEELHTMWAALLANAASADYAHKVRPGFIATLQQMAPDEAAVLNWIFVRVSPTSFAMLPMQDLERDLGFTSGEDGVHLLRVCLGGLEAAGIFTSLTTVEYNRYVFAFDTGDDNFSTGLPWQLTRRGLDFVRACHPPESK